MLQVVDIGQRRRDVVTQVGIVHRQVLQVVGERGPTGRDGAVEEHPLDLEHLELVQVDESGAQCVCVVARVPVRLRDGGSRDLQLKNRPIGFPAGYELPQTAVQARGPRDEQVWGVHQPRLEVEQSVAAGRGAVPGTCSREIEK